MLKKNLTQFKRNSLLLNSTQRKSNFKIRYYLLDDSSFQIQWTEHATENTDFCRTAKFFL